LFPALLITLAGLALGQSTPLTADYSSPPDWLSGREAEQVFDRKISVLLQDVELRDALSRLMEENRIAILRDRRIDPDAPLSINAPPQPAKDVLAEISRAAGGELRIVGATAYIGPPKAAEKLRTLIALRSEELARQPRLSREQRRRLNAPRSIQWSDLERPADIVERIAKQYGLKLSGADLIPHDRWGAAGFVAENAAVALSLPLIQFDLTFQWDERGEGIQIVSVPEVVTVTQKHRPRPHSVDEALELLKTALPGLAIEVERGTLIVEGTVEQQEAVAEALRPRERVTRRTMRAKSVDPLGDQRVTLRLRTVPAQALLNDLVKRYKMEMVYDREALAAAGVDLTEKVDVDVSKVTIDEYLEAFLRQIGAEFDRDGLQVTIRAPVKPQ